MPHINILNVSHRKREPSDFHYIVESGFGGQIHLFVHFILPVVVIFDGIEYITDNSACIIFTPSQRQEYKPHGDVFVNDFLIFEVAEPNFAARFGLPEDEIFYISNGDEVTRRMENITYSITDKLIDRRHQTQHHVLRLFETLSESCIDNNPSQKRMFEIKQRFIALRDEIRKNPSEWSVDKMAKKVWFTRSRFTVLYNEFFSMPPKEDLINIKIDYAKRLLETTCMPITDVSSMCGYTSVEHFIRIFNKRVGRTPLQYRKTCERKLLM